jgi:hypothetical protein
MVNKIVSVEVGSYFLISSLKGKSHYVDRKKRKDDKIKLR